MIIKKVICVSNYIFKRSKYHLGCSGCSMYDTRKLSPQRNCIYYGNLYDLCREVNIRSKSYSKTSWRYIFYRSSIDLIRNRKRKPRK